MTTGIETPTTNVETTTLTPAPRRVGKALSTVEKSELRQQETVIQQGLNTFLDVGNALLDIRDKRLYREEFETFQSYCRVRWGMSKTHANRLISAAAVVHNLGDVSEITPLKETVVRPLTMLKPAMQRRVWEEIVSEHPNADEISAKVVNAKVRELRPRSQQTASSRRGGLAKASDGSRIDAAAAQLVHRSEVIDRIRTWAKKNKIAKAPLTELLGLVEEIA